MATLVLTGGWASGRSEAGCRRAVPTPSGHTSPSGLILPFLHCCVLLPACSEAVLWPGCGRGAQPGGAAAAARLARLGAAPAQPPLQRLCLPPVPPRGGSISWSRPPCRPASHVPKPSTQVQSCLTKQDASPCPPAPGPSLHHLIQPPQPILSPLCVQAAQLEGPPFQTYLQYLQQGLFASFQPPPMLETVHQLFQRLALPQPSPPQQGGSGGGTEVGGMQGLSAGRGDRGQAHVPALAAAAGQPGEHGGEQPGEERRVQSAYRFSGAGVQHKGTAHADYALLLAACAAPVWLVPEALHEVRQAAGRCCGLAGPVEGSQAGSGRAPCARKAGGCASCG